MDLQLNGKKALILGSSRGLGFATAHKLAAEGAAAVLNSRDSAKLSEAVERIKAETGAEAFGIPGDSTKPNFAELLVTSAVEHLGGLDILVTNSGGPPAGTFETVTEQDWLNAIDGCLMVHVRAIRAALPYLKLSKNPAILTITSVAIKQPNPVLVLSNSVRAATGGLTKSLSLEFAKYGIRVNSILPGLIDTERIAELNEYRAENSNLSLDQIQTEQAQSVPLGRIGSPEEFGATAAFLVSPAASYITGAFVQVDGGSLKGW
ncbi:MAG TPA: SDR family oxidoreductase [Bellilinea sp.]|nr:SDR family oxidoreductase [Bellilinea sp.]